LVLIDANLLLYAYDSTSRLHEPARERLEVVFSGRELVRLPWVVVLAFLRITTHARVLERPLAHREARAIVGSWLEQPNVDFLGPGERHWDILGSVISEADAHGKLVVDAHIAALALEYGGTVYTNDRDFKCSDGVPVELPLRSS